MAKQTLLIVIGSCAILAACVAENVETEIPAIEEIDQMIAEAVEVGRLL